VSEAIYELLRSDGSIVSNKALRHSIGINETDLYSELISRYYYFESRNQLTEDGYFFNTVTDLESGTALSKKQQLSALKKLENLGLIKCDLRGMPAKRYFKIIFTNELISKYILQGKEIQQMLQKGTTRSYKKEQQDVPKGNTNNTNKIIQINNTKDNDNGAFNQCTVYDKELIQLVSIYMNDLYKQRRSDRARYLSDKITELFTECMKLHIKGGY